MTLCHHSPQDVVNVGNDNVGNEDPNDDSIIDGEVIDACEEMNSHIADAAQTFEGTCNQAKYIS